MKATTSKIIRIVSLTSDAKSLPQSRVKKIKFDYKRNEGAENKKIKCRFLSDNSHGQAQRNTEEEKKLTQVKVKIIKYLSLFSLARAD